MNYSLRDNQIIPIEKGLEVLLDKSKNGRKEVLCLPVAFGKSICISEIVQRLPKDGNILVIQPSEELLVQGLAKIEKILEVNVFSASLNRKETGRIVYATNASISDDFLQRANIKYVIWDEVDWGSKSGSTLPKKLKKAKINNILGLTATPLYLQGGMQGSAIKIMTRTRGKLFTKICHVTQMKEMLDLGYWSPLKLETEVLEKGSLVLNSSGAEYTEQSVAEFTFKNDIKTKIKEKLKLMDGQSTLIFVSGISNVEEIARETGSVFVHSKLDKKTRRKNVDGFLCGKYKTMVNDSILGVGFDFPGLLGIIDANPTASVRTYTQRLGRGVRILEGKQFCRVFDLSGNYERFGELSDMNYEDLEGYGWGLFKGDILLTDYPISASIRPTKQSLISKIDFKKSGQNNPDSKFYFGKYKDKLVSQVYKENKSYLTWLLDQKDFKWYGEQGVNLKKAIRIVLGLEVFVESTTKQTVNTKELIEEYTNNIRSLQDLKDIW